MLGHFSYFFRILWPSQVSMAFFIDFFRNFFDFGRILEGFGEGFGMFFLRFFAFGTKSAILQKSLFFLRKIAIFHDSSSQKSTKNLSQMAANFA